MEAFYDRNFLADGIKFPINFDLEAVPHFLVAGQTGSGKTYGVRYLLAKMAKHYTDMELTLVDYKQYDFAEFRGMLDYHGHDTAFDGLRYFNTLFEQRLHGSDNRKNRLVMFFDEWSGFLAGLSKKDADEAKSILLRLLCLSRAYNMTCIIGVQKALSELFSGNRDNFGNILLMGQASKEQRSMLMSDYLDELAPMCGRGEGHLSIAGQGLKHVVVPSYDVDRANTLIRRVMSFGKE